MRITLWFAIEEKKFRLFLFFMGIIINFETYSNKSYSYGWLKSAKAV